MSTGESTGNTEHMGTHTRPGACTTLKVQGGRVEGFGQGNISPRKFGLSNRWPIFPWPIFPFAICFLPRPLPPLPLLPLPLPSASSLILLYRTILPLTMEKFVTAHLKAVVLELPLRAKLLLTLWRARGPSPPHPLPIGLGISSWRNFPCRNFPRAKFLPTCAGITS